MSNLPKATNRRYRPVKINLSVRWSQRGWPYDRWREQIKHVRRGWWSIVCRSGTYVHAYPTDKILAWLKGILPENMLCLFHHHWPQRSHAPRRRPRWGCWTRSRWLDHTNHLPPEQTGMGLLSDIKPWAIYNTPPLFESIWDPMLGQCCSGKIQLVDYWWLLYIIAAESLTLRLFEVTMSGKKDPGSNPISWSSVPTKRCIPAVTVPYSGKTCMMTQILISH